MAERSGYIIWRRDTKDQPLLWCHVVRSLRHLARLLRACALERAAHVTQAEFTQYFACKERQPVLGNPSAGPGLYYLPLPRAGLAGECGRNGIIWAAFRIVPCTHSSKGIGWLLVYYFRGKGSFTCKLVTSDQVSLFRGVIFIWANVLGEGISGVEMGLSHVNMARWHVLSHLSWAARDIETPGLPGMGWVGLCCSGSSHSDHLEMFCVTAGSGFFF